MIQIRKFRGGGTPSYFVTANGYIARRNSDDTSTIFPFIKGSTYEKYKSSPEFMHVLELAFNRYSQRLNNERKQIIHLSGKTRPVTIKGKGTYNIPTEVLDNIVRASKVAGIDPKQGLAIAIKESSGYTDPNRINSYYGGALTTKHWRGVAAPNYAGPSTIVSNWQYFKNSPYIGLLRSWENSGWDVDRVSEDAKYQQKRHQKEYDRYDEETINNKDILTDMFMLPLNAINPGDSGYTNTIRTYMKNMSYKFGGKI